MGIPTTLQPRHLGVFISLSVVIALSYPAPDANAGEIGVNIYGLSFHFDRRDETGMRFNEINYGAGATYTFYSRERSRYYLEVALYHDSYRETASYGAVGYDYRVFDELYCGVMAGLIHSKSVSESGSVVGAIPLLRYRWAWATVSLAYLPEFPGINAYPGIASYLTIWIQSLF